MSRHGDALLRLRSHQERNALAGERHDAMRGRFNALAGRGSAEDLVAVADGLFITPPAIAARMAGLLDLQEGDRLLEPSAGTGHLIDAAQAACPGLKITAAEQCPRLCRHLFERYPGVSLRTGDVLGMTFPAPFDAVLMNPPFRRGTDVQHILHARSLLRPGGRLVSLCYNGVAQQRRLQPIVTTWERLPPGSFRTAGTEADVILLILIAGDPTEPSHQGPPRTATAKVVA